MPSPAEISVSQLTRLIGTPQAPILIDVRIDEDFDDDPRLIPGSVRHPHRDIASLAQHYRNSKIVIACQRGKKLSQGAAAILRESGVSAEILQGGTVAWADAAAPMVSADKLPPRNPEGRTVWVTRHRPKIDRIACPWLIRRFVDPTAQFLFVAPSEVLNVAEKFDATPFDVEDVFWSHRGDQCTFDIMIEEFDIATEPLLRLATIVRGADTNRHDLAPQAAGLLALSVGLSRMFRDDIAQLDAGMLLYDALYRWSRDGVDESHDWPSALSGG